MNGADSEEDKNRKRFATSVVDPDRDPVSLRPLDHGSGMGKKIRIRNRDEQPGSYFRELRNNFLKYLNSLMRIRDPGWKKFGSGINIPDPQHWCPPVLLTPDSCVIFSLPTFP
jgi:hypothetical protein